MKGHYSGGGSGGASRDPFFQRNIERAAADKAVKEADQRAINQSKQAAQRGAQAQVQSTEAMNRAFDINQKARNQQYLTEAGSALRASNKASVLHEAERSQLLREADQQSKDATRVYGNLSKRMDDVVNRSERDARNAMSLQQYMDPAQSQAFQNVSGLFQTQAQNEGRAGLADAGVLASLGAQAMGQGLQGMGPMTAGQQMGLLAQSQRQAGEAYANTQRRMQALRDQGLQQGLQFHDKAYEAGLGARDRYTSDMLNREGLTARGIQNLSGLRGERAGFQNDLNAERQGRISAGLGLSQQRYGMESGFASDALQRGTALEGMRAAAAEAQFNRERGIQNDAQAAMLQQQQIDAQRQASRNAMWGAGLGALGTIGGALVAGPAGAAIGGAIGGAAGSAMSRPSGVTAAVPQAMPVSSGVAAYNPQRYSLQARMGT